MKINLFPFPFAGGSARYYANWRTYLNTDIELRCIELAGRGKRIYEHPYRSMDELLIDIVPKMLSHSPSTPYALFGHSMGGKIVFEMAKAIYEMNLPPPLHIFVSGRGAPGVPDKDNKLLSALSDQELIEELKNFGGTPPGFFSSPELVSLFLPILRNDFALAHELENNTPGIIPYNITALFGSEEEFSEAQIKRWKSCTTGSCRLVMFKGGHFFINNYTKEIISLINTTLTKYRK